MYARVCRFVYQIWDDVASCVVWQGAAEVRTSIVAGERLAASAATQTSSKLVPILGALISGAMDCATTLSVGRCCVRVFR